MRMNSILIPLAFIAMSAGCKSFPFFSFGEVKEPPARQGDFTQAQLEWKTHSFDGETLRGRLLVSPTTSALRVDRRLIENIHLSVESVMACDNSTSIGSLLMDVSAPAPQPEDIVTLSPGSWYGRDVRFLLFSEQVTQQSLPECFEAEFVYHALDIKNAGRIRARVRTNSSTTDGGAETP